MKQSIQDKIEQIKELAKSQHLASQISAATSNNEDSLLKAIRNKEDADLFMTELEAAIKASRSK